MLSEFPQGTAPYESQIQSRGNLSYMETISTWLAWLGPPERVGMCVCGGGEFFADTLTLFQWEALCVEVEFYADIS